jgi:hypothetical protein
LEKMCWLRRGVRWRLTCATKCLAIMVFKKKKKSVPVIFEPPCILNLLNRSFKIQYLHLVAARGEQTPQWKCFSLIRLDTTS